MVELARRDDCGRQSERRADHLRSHYIIHINSVNRIIDNFNIQINFTDRRGSVNRLQHRWLSLRHYRNQVHHHPLGTCVDQHRDHGLVCVPTFQISDKAGHHIANAYIAAHPGADHH